MASAAPLVATAVGNLPRLTLDVAVLVPPRDPVALAAAIESVLDEPVRAARMRHAGVDRASGYAWARTAALTAEVYQEVALRSRRSAQLSPRRGLRGLRRPPDADHRRAVRPP